MQSVVAPMYGPRANAHAASISPGASDEALDVTAYAQSALMFGDVSIEVEAFGVTVTRRPQARIEHLTAYERARLLDVLVCAKQVQLAAIDDEIAFNVWGISSDARDAQPRAIWLTLRREPDGRFVIRLSDV